MAWPQDNQAGDFAALHGHQAVLFLDESMDLPGGAEPARVHRHNSADVVCPRARTCMCAVLAAGGQ
jgi:hypothetical protein